MKKSARKIKDSIAKGAPKVGKTISEKVGTKKTRPAKSGRRQDMKLYQHLMTRYNARKELRMRKKAEYLATLPKGRWNRFRYRAHPKRVARFVFSRDGLIFGAKAFGVMALLGAVTMFVTFAYYRKDLPKNITDLKACSQGQKTSYYDRTGEILLWRGEGNVDCRPVALDQVSPYLKNAVFAIEDTNFYDHPGFDVRGTMRAALSNLKGDANTQGGSTLTQQYVKLAVLNDNEQRVSRKIKELILSIELERTYEKDEILQAYLNEISFGSVYNGAEAASQGFFNKSAKDLTLDEAATFAAAIQAPGAYWEAENQADLIGRRDYVLDRMASLGYIKQEEADAAKKIDTIAKVVPDQNKYKDILAPHFVLEVQKQLEEEIGAQSLRKLGYKVITTVDMNLQKAAEEAVTSNMWQVQQYGLNNAALVSEEVATGEVVAYVGSYDFNNPVYGRKNVAGTPRSPGSSFKPYDYAALMASSENWGAGSIMYDLNTTWSGFGAPYKPTDYDQAQPGPTSIRYALGGSRNTPAIKAMYIAGIEQTHQLAEKLGLRSGITGCSTPGAKDCGTILSTSIGDGGEVRLDENVHGYATFSRNGKYIPQKYVLKILDSKGKVIRDNTKEPVAEDAIDPQIAYIVNDMLADRSASYFRNSPSYKFRVLGDYDDAGIPSAIKTGTTNNRENGWMMGHTPKYATGVWVGHNENKSANNANMEYMTGPMWAAFMKKAHENVGKVDYWPKPEGIKTVAHDSAFYALVKGSCTGVRLGNICGFGQSDIYPSWYTPKKSSNTEQKVVIDTVTNKRATDCTPERARKEITGGGAIIPEVDSSDPNYNNFMTPIRARLKSPDGVAIPAENEVDDYHSCSDVRPTVTISMPANCNGNCTISASVTRGTKPLKNLYFKMNGSVMGGGTYEISANGGVYSYDLVPETSGPQEFSVEVVDEGLYDATDSQNSSLTAVPFNLDSVVSQGASVRLTWDDIGGSYSLRSSGGGNGLGLGCTPSGSKCTALVPKATLGSPGTYSLSVESSSPDRTTNSRSFSF